MKRKEKKKRLFTKDAVSIINKTRNEKKKMK